jgi:hypothetical protein
LLEVRGERPYASVPKQAAPGGASTPTEGLRHGGGSSMPYPDSTGGGAR